MPDKLDEIFEIQKIHDAMFNNIDLIKADKEQLLSFAKQRVLDIFGQLSSLLNAFDWKEYTVDRNEDLDNAKEQLIDIQKFIIGFGIILGMNPNDWLNMYKFKSQMLDERWKQNLIKSHDVDVIISDLDNVLSDYDKGFIEYMKAKGYTQISAERKVYNIFESFNINRYEEEKLNGDFISLGGFKHLESFKERIDILNDFHHKGIKIAIITARPVWRYNRITKDTIDWLKENNVLYDMLFFDKDKSDVVINKIMPAKIIGFIEDRDKHALEISNIGVKVFLIDKNYNRNLSDSELIIRIYNDSEMKIKLIAELLNFEKKD